MSTMYSLHEAVRKARCDINAASFAFYPKCGNAKVLGGTIFVVGTPGVYGGLPRVALRTLTGMISSEAASSDVVDLHDPDEQAGALVAQYGVDPRELLFVACRPYVADLALGTSLRYALALLNGSPQAMPKHASHLATDWQRRIFRHLRSA